MRKSTLQFALLFAVLLLPFSSLYGQSLPRVLVYFKGPHSDLVSSNFEEILINGGVRMIDRNQLKNIKEVDAALSQNDKGKLLALKNRYGVEAIVAGKVKWDFVQERMVYGRKYRYYRPGITAKLIVSDTAQILFSKSVRGQLSSTTSRLDRMSKRLARRLLNSLKSKWARRARSQNEFEVVISRVPGMRKLRIFENYLANRPRVKGFTRSNYAKRTAFLRVNYQGTRLQLERDITSFPQAKLTLVRATANRVEFVVGKPKPQDNEAPQISILSPQDNSFTKSSKVKVAVKATDNKKVSALRINGVEVAGKKGIYRRTLQKSQGPLVINIEAVDGAGNVSRDQCRVIVDSTSPRLQLFEPGEGDFVDSPVVMVRGRAKDAYLKEVKVNGNPVTCNNRGVFATRVKLGKKGILRILASDRAGNVSRIQREFKIDSQAPSISILSPSSGSLLDSQTVVVRVRASDDLGLAEVRIDGQVASKKKKFYQLSLSLSDGTHTIWATAVDRAQKSSRTKVEIQIDTTPPHLTILSPQEGETMGSQKFEVRGRAMDPNLDSVTIGGKKVTVNANGYFTTKVKVKKKGRFLAMARDLAGNVSRQVRTVNVDVKGPWMSLVAPSPNSMFLTDKAQVWGFVGDASGIGEVKVNGTPVRLRKLRRSRRRMLQRRFKKRLPRDIWRFQGQVSLKEGKNLLEIRAEDGHGNSSLNKVVVFADLYPPQLTFETNSGQLVSEKKILVRGKVNKQVSKVIVNGQAAKLKAKSNGGMFFTRKVALQEGRNTIVARTQDSHGRQARSQIAVTLDSQAPKIKILNPSPNVFLNHRSLVVEGICRDPHLSSVKVLGREVQVGPQGRFRKSFTMKKDGKYYFTVKAKDTLGHSDSVRQIFVVDTRAPRLKITSPSKGITRNSRKIQVVGTVRDKYLEVVTVNGQKAQVKKGKFFAQLEFANDGVHRLVVKARDKAENVSQSNRSITIDTTPPKVGFEVVIKGSVDKPGTRVWINGQEVGVDQNGNWQAKIDITRISVIEIVARDPLGNVTRKVRKLR